MNSEIVKDISCLENMADEWAGLLERSATNEPTLSPIWMLNWWRVFGQDEGRKLRVILFRENGRLVGLAPLLIRRFRYRSGVSVKRLEFLASGEDYADEICSDYLGILVEKGFEQKVAQEFARILDSEEMGGWNELLLPRMNGESVLPALLCTTLRDLGAVRYSLTGGAPYARLEKTWDEYLETLSSSRRSYISRSIRVFEKWAGNDVKIECVARPEDIERGFEVLQKLHSERWTEAGHKGVFASSLFCDFHKKLMAAFLEKDALDLMWLVVQGEPFAVLYNFIWNNKVHFYQSGRKMDVPKKIYIGVVAQAYSIQRAIEAGMSEYDFLDGVSQHKMRFCQDVRPLCDLHLFRPSIKDKLRRIGDQGLGLARMVKRLFENKRRTE
ncbi:MAG: GNAT family N-acetyltransferase [Pseudomonadota bacterium]